MLTYDHDDPEIGIRCRNSTSKEVRFLWSWEKFLDRLDLMKEWYADLMDDGIINREHPIDPWSNITEADIEHKKKMDQDSIQDQLEAC